MSCGEASVEDDAEKVYVLWLDSGDIEEFECEEDADQEMRVMHTREGLRGLLFHDRESAVKQWNNIKK